MILAIDIGNTNTHLAYFSAPEKIMAFEAIPNTALDDKFLDKVLKINVGAKVTSRIKTVLLCSTNPEVEPAVNEWSKKVFKIKPSKAGRDFDIPVSNRADAPDKVGADRLLNALAARKIASGKKPLLIISCGTAITFDIISAKGEFLGGVIAPGISLMAKSLYQNCALLPWVKLPSKKPAVLGRNTEAAIASGVYYGGAGLAENIIKELARSLQIKPAGLDIIITGGDAPLLQPAIGFKTNLIPHLTLKGLVWAYLDPN
jgi:type III pantothenate kinase